MRLCHSTSPEDTLSLSLGGMSAVAISCPLGLSTPEQLQRRHPTFSTTAVTPAWPSAVNHPGPTRPRSIKPGIVTHACDPSTQQTEARASQRLHRETLSQSRPLKEDPFTPTTCWSTWRTHTVVQLPPSRPASHRNKRQNYFLTQCGRCHSGNQ